MIFSHPDYTVGLGIAPSQSPSSRLLSDSSLTATLPGSKRVAGLRPCCSMVDHRRSGISPYPEDPYSFKFLLIFKILSYYNLHRRFTVIIITCFRKYSHFYENTAFTSQISFYFDCAYIPVPLHSRYPRVSSRSFHNIEILLN